LRPGTELGEIIAEQRVLILRVGGTAAAAADVLDRLQEGRDAFDLAELRPQSRNDLIGRNAPFGQRLQGNGHVGACAAAPGPETASPHRAGHGADRRILLNDRRDFLQFALHELK